MNIKKSALTVIFSAFILLMGILFAVLPKKEISENEKRVLATFPDVSAENLSNGEFTKGFEEYLSDHFPFRDFFYSLGSYFSLFTGQNGQSGVYSGKNGYLFTEPKEYSEEKLIKNIKSLSDFSKKTNLPSSMIVIPSSGSVMEECLPKFHKTYNDEKITETAKENSGKINFIDVFEELRKNAYSNSYYYKTDHHLTSSGSKAIYDIFCDKNNLEKESFSLKNSFDGFYGTAFSSSGLFLNESDKIELISADNPSVFTVTIRDGATSKTFDSLYFYENLENMDKYPFFIDGNHAEVNIDNESNKNGKRLLIVKDSFAHCFTTFLAENYEHITLIDLRYFRGSVEKTANENSINEILYLYGAENLATSTDIGRIGF